MNAPRKRLDGRATMDRVVEFARAELAAHGPVDFNLDRVIAESGVSRGSIYHHFGSRAGLITAVEIDDLVNVYREANDVTRRAVESASSGRELLDLLALTFQLGANEIGRNSRSRRIATLVASENIPALHEFLRDRQREGGRTVFAEDRDWCAESVQRTIKRRMRNTTSAPIVTMKAAINVPPWPFVPVSGNVGAAEDDGADDGGAVVVVGRAGPDS